STTLVYCPCSSSQAPPARNLRPLPLHAALPFWEGDVEIEVIDGARRYGNGRMLPAGPLREPAERGRRCDFRVVNLGHGGAPVTAPGTGRAQARATPVGETGFGEWPMYLRTRNVLPLAGGRPRPLAAFSG